jgi:peptide/nickel transport system substrate-binding protein
MQEEVPTVIPVFFDLLSAQRDYVQGWNLHPRGAVYRLDLVSLTDKGAEAGLTPL